MKKFVLILSLISTGCGSRGSIPSQQIDPRVNPFVSSFLEEYCQFNLCPLKEKLDIQVIPKVYENYSWYKLPQDQILFLIEESFWNSLEEYQKEYLIFHNFSINLMNQPISSNLDYTNPQIPDELTYLHNKQLMLTNLFSN